MSRRALVARAPKVEPEIVSPRDAAMVGGALEGASRFERMTAAWNAPRASADAIILPEKSEADARVQDTMRNDAHVQGAGNLWRDNIVGAQFMLNAKPEWEVLGLTEAWAEEFQREVETVFTLAAESPKAWLDAQRINTLTSMVRLAVLSSLGAGEVLATAEYDRDRARPFKTCIQMVDPDRLSTPEDRASNDNMRGGILRNTYGAPQTYFIRNGHPGDVWSSANSWRWTAVDSAKPWGRQQVIHIFEQARPDQSRGISEMVAALKTIKVTRRFRDITLQSAIVNATYAASIESDLPPAEVFASLGAGQSDAVEKYAGSWLGAIGKYVAGADNLNLDGVRIPHLFPGTKLQMRTAAQPGGVGQEFEQSLLRHIASALGVSYEQLSRDYSQSNYASVRAAMGETWKFMQAKKKMVADRFATAVYRLWLEEAVNNDEIKSFTRAMAARLCYTEDGRQNIRFEALCACDWIGASRGQIDELKETQAAGLRIKFGLSTWEEELGRLGKDWRKVFAQREREEKEIKRRGLSFATEDPALNAASGQPRENSRGSNAETGEGS